MFKKKYYEEDYEVESGSTFVVTYPNEGERHYIVLVLRRKTNNSYIKLTLDSFLTEEEMLFDILVKYSIKVIMTPNKTITVILPKKPKPWWKRIFS